MISNEIIIKQSKGIMSCLCHNPFIYIELDRMNLSGILLRQFQ